MIVRHVQEGWEVVLQPAHALLAARLAAAWRRADRPARWLELLLATARHDDHQPPFRARRHLTELGAPRGFTVGKGERDATSLEQPRRAVAAAARQDAFAALLTARHVEQLYGGRADDEPELAAFLAELARRRRRWREALDLSEAAEEGAYGILRWCDRLSLVLCEGELPEDGRRLELAPLPDGRASEARRRDGAVAVAPWPFEPDEVAVEVEWRLLRRLRFESDEELERALEEAPLRRRAWRLRPG